MTRRVVVRPEARDELFDAQRWYEERAQGLGREFAEAINQIIGRIASDPAKFPCVHGDTRRAVLARFPYAVSFRDASDRVVVLAVHGRQDPSRWQTRG